MTNEQLTDKVVELLGYREKAQEEHKVFHDTLKSIQENMNIFTKLAEDVHILAINMENMQKAQDDMSKKVDALTSKEFMEYKETKKMVKQNIINKVTGGLIGAVLTGLVWLTTMFFAS